MNLPSTCLRTIIVHFENNTRYVFSFFCTQTKQTLKYWSGLIQPATSCPSYHVPTSEHNPERVISKSRTSADIFYWLTADAQCQSSPLISTTTQCFLYTLGHFTTKHIVKMLFCELLTLYWLQLVSGITSRPLSQKDRARCMESRQILSC